MDKIKKFASDLKNLDKAKDYDSFFDTKADFIKANSDNVLELIKSFSPETHTVPILYLLTPLYTVSDISQKTNLRELIMYSRNFLCEFKAESISASVYFEVMFGMFVQYFSLSLLHPDKDRPHWKSSNIAQFYVDRPMLGIKPLKMAIKRLQTKETQFTVCHPYFAMLCVKAKAYRHALPIVSKKILSGYTDPTKLKGGSSSMHPMIDAMNYNYYRGLIFTGLEDYEKAKHCFQLVLETPTTTLHILQVNAFKKLVLLIWLTSTHNPNDSEHKNLKVSIKTLLLSKGIFGKHLESLCSTYSKADSINNFFILLNQEEIRKDINLGLVKKVINKLRNEILESLAQTNTVLGIEELSEKLENHRKFLDFREEQDKVEMFKKLKDKLMVDVDFDMSYRDDDVHTVLLKMIKNGKIRAKIDTSKNIVAFDEENVDIKDLVKTLESQSSEIVEILKEVEDADKLLILQKKSGIVDVEDIDDAREVWMMDDI